MRSSAFLPSAMVIAASISGCSSAASSAPTITVTQETVRYVTVTAAPPAIYTAAPASSWSASAAPAPTTLSNPTCEAAQNSGRTGRAAAYYLIETEPFATADDAKACPQYADVIDLALTGMSDGSYKVADKTSNEPGERSVKAGTYKTESNTHDCYWERVTGGGDIIANNFITAAPDGVTVTIKPDDGGFTSKGCTAWLPKD